jgi:hypothetical protein
MRSVVLRARYPYLCYHTMECRRYDNLIYYQESVSTDTGSLDSFAPPLKHRLVELEGTHMVNWIAPATYRQGKMLA